MKNFINISDHSSGDLRAIIDEAKTRKLSRKGFNKSAPDDDKPFEGSVGKDFRLVLGSANNLPGFDDKIIGLKKGQKVSVKSMFPKNYPNEALKGKDVVFKIEVKDILEPKKIEIGKELAERNGAKDLESLKKSIKEHLKKNNDDVSFSIIKKEILDLLDNKHEFQLPESMVKQEFNSILAQSQNDIKREGNDAKESKIDKKLESEYKKLSERRVKLGLIVSEIGLKNNVKIEEKEVENAIIKHTKQYPGKENEIIEYYKKNPHAVAAIRGPLFEDKVIRLIVKESKIKEKIVSNEELSQKLESSQSFQQEKVDNKNDQIKNDK